MKIRTIILLAFVFILLAAAIAIGVIASYQVSNRDKATETLTSSPTVDVELIRRRVLCSTVEVLATTNPRPYNICMGTDLP